MYELIKAGERSYYIDCPAKIGVYLINDSEVYLIDSGSDKDAGRKVRQILEKNNWKLKAILNTHSNADHIGGNHYLQTQTGCKIFADGIEGDFTKHTVLEPSFLYGGYPFKELRHKFLMAQESSISDFNDIGFPKEIEILPLPGHFFDMVGFKTPDNTAFIADCLSSRATLEKYGIPFIYDVDSYLKTLDSVENMKAAMFVPAHAEATDDIAELVRFNRQKVLEIADRLADVCKEEITFENVLKKMFDMYSLKMNYEQYVLVGSTIRSYLSWLKDTERFTANIKDNMLYWTAL